MSEELISVGALASQFGKRKQTVFKVLRRLRIEPRKLRSSDRRGQLVSYVTAEESRRVAAELRSTDLASTSGGENAAPPGRFKGGFTVTVPERLRSLRCSAPFTKVVRTWPCKMLWERTAIDCVTEGCKQLHTEVFRTQSIEPVLQRCEQFFNLMPKVNEPDR